MSPIKDLTVHRGWAGGGTHVWSPFVVKLEARLRFAGVPHATGAGGPRGAPKGKIPYVEFRQQGAAAPGSEEGAVVRMEDSALVARYLVEEGSLSDLNAGLSPVDRARDLATRALLEEKLCFYHVSSVDPFSSLAGAQSSPAHPVLTCLPAPHRQRRGGLTTTTSCATMPSRRYRCPCACLSAR